MTWHDMSYLADEGVKGGDPGDPVPGEQPRLQLGDHEVRGEGQGEEVEGDGHQPGQQRQVAPCSQLNLILITMANPSMFVT